MGSFADLVDEIFEIYSYYEFLLFMDFFRSTYAPLNEDVRRREETEDMTKRNRRYKDRYRTRL